MSITVFCPHGHAVVLDDPQRDHACPRCGTILTAASPFAPPELPGALMARPQPRRSRDEDEDEDEDEEVRPRKRRPRADEDDEDDDRPRKRKDDRVQAGPPRKRAAARAEPEDDDAEDEDDDEATPQKLTRRQKQMSMVRLGLIFHVVKFWLMLAGLGFGLVTLPLVLFAVLLTGSLGGMILLQVTWGFAITLAPMVGTIGSVLCAMCPARSEARGTIIVSIIFDVLAPIFGLFQLIMWFAWAGSGDERVGQLQNYMLYARLACTLVSWWLVQIFLRKFCFYIRESQLASESLNVIVHLLMATVVTPTLLIATIVVAIVMPGLIVTILFFATLGWMIYFAVTFPYRQVRLLLDVRQKIWLKYLKPDDD